MTRGSINRPIALRILTIQSLGSSSRVVRVSVAVRCRNRHVTGLFHFCRFDVVQVVLQVIPAHSVPQTLIQQSVTKPVRLWWWLLGVHRTAATLSRH